MQIHLNAYRFINTDYAKMGMKNQSIYSNVKRFGIDSMAQWNSVVDYKMRSIVMWPSDTYQWHTYIMDNYLNIWWNGINSLFLCLLPSQQGTHLIIYHILGIITGAGKMLMRASVFNNGCVENIRMGANNSRNEFHWLNYNEIHWYVSSWLLLKGHPIY